MISRSATPICFVISLFSLDLRRVLVFLLGWAAVTCAADEATDTGRNAAVRATPFAGESRMALVIGNAAYADIPLTNAVNDARAMSRALTALGFQVVTLENATQTVMKRAIDEFGDQLAGPGKKGVGLFYYAGHGVQVQGRNYLIPVGARIKTERQVEYEAVDVSRVLGIMEDARNSLNLVILDACRDNPFARSARNALGGLASMDAAAGMLIAYATAPGRTASDGAGENGLYTEQLVRHMSAPGLKVEEVFKRVRVDVERLSDGLQVPWESSSLRGDFYFAGRMQAEARKSTLPDGPRLDEEEVLWRAIEGSGHIDDYDEYLKHFPQGRFAPAARVRLRQLQSTAAGRDVSPSAAQALLTIQSHPSGATVHLDGQPQGVTPMALPVTPGVHRLELRLAGYDDWVDELGFVAGQQRKVDQTLVATARYAAIDARLVSPDATVLLDGRHLGSGGTLFEKIDPGSYELRVVRPKGRSSKRVITLEARQVHAVPWPPEPYSLAVFPGRYTGRYAETVDKRYGTLSGREWALVGLDEALKNDNLFSVSYAYHAIPPAEQARAQDLKKNAWKGVFSVEGNQSFLRQKAMEMNLDAILLLAVNIDGNSGPVEAILYDRLLDRFHQVRDKWKSGEMTLDVRKVVALALRAFVDAHASE